jgi:hypothetical protein
VTQIGSRLVTHTASQPQITCSITNRTCRQHLASYSSMLAASLLHSTMHITVIILARMASNRITSMRPSVTIVKSLLGCSWVHSTINLTRSNRMNQVIRTRDRFLNTSLTTSSLSLPNHSYRTSKLRITTSHISSSNHISSSCSSSSTNSSHSSTSTQVRALKLRASTLNSTKISKISYSSSTHSRTRCSNSSQPSSNRSKLL